MFESRGVGGFGLRVILLMRARIPKRTIFSPIWTESPPLAFHSFSTFLLPFVSLPGYTSDVSIRQRSLLVLCHLPSLRHQKPCRQPELELERQAYLLVPH